MAAIRPERLYRAVERFPPGSKDYRTPLQRGRPYPEGATEEDRRSWDALSSWETAELALAAARSMLSAKWIVRYDIPPNAPVGIEKTGPPGHWDIHAGADALDPYLAPDFKLDVPRR